MNLLCILNNFRGYIIYGSTYVCIYGCTFWIVGRHCTLHVYFNYQIFHIYQILEENVNTVTEHCLQTSQNHIIYLGINLSILCILTTVISRICCILYHTVGVLVSRSCTHYTHGTRKWRRQRFVVCSRCCIPST